MYSSKAILFTLLFAGNMGLRAQEKPKSKVDYDAFLATTKELTEYRKSRLIDIDTFNAYSQEPNTIILDTRSKKAYDTIHLKGAIHLNFSDFTDETLAATIGDWNTRILIYCNNNFQSSLKVLTNKRTPLALNIPTFINLYGYGYHNIYELKSYLSEDNPKVQFDVATVQP